MKTPLVKRTFGAAKPYIKDGDPRMEHLATMRQVAGALGIPLNAAVRICTKNFEHVANRDETSPGVTAEVDRLLYERLAVIQWAIENRTSLEKIRFVQKRQAPPKKVAEKVTKPVVTKPGPRSRCQAKSVKGPYKGEQCRKFAAMGATKCVQHLAMEKPKKDYGLRVHLTIEGARRAKCGSNLAALPDQVRQAVTTTDMSKVTCKNCQRRPKAGK